MTDRQEERRLKEAQEKLYHVMDNLRALGEEIAEMTIRQNAFRDEAAKLLVAYPTLHLRRKNV